MEIAPGVKVCFKCRAVQAVPIETAKPKEKIKKIEHDHEWRWDFLLPVKIEKPDEVGRFISISGGSPGQRFKRHCLVCGTVEEGMR